MNISSLVESKTFKGVLYGVGVCAILLVVFVAGQSVGYHRASFAYRMGENYYKGFAGPRPGPLDGAGDRYFVSGHGTSGAVIRVASGSLVIRAREGVEKVVLVDAGTIYKFFRDDVASSSIQVDDQVTVIGAPNANGQIQAKLIRVLPPLPGEAR